MATPVREYRRVSSEEPVASTDSATSIPAATASSTAVSRTVSERLMDKAIAAIWVSIAVAVSYWTDTIPMLLHPGNNAILGLVQLSAVGFGISTVLVLYLTIYLPYCKGLTDSSAWPVYCPRVIPTITITGVATSLCLVRAVWPAWGILAPLILGIQALGLLFTLHFIPVWPQ